MTSQVSKWFCDICSIYNESSHCDCCKNHKHDIEEFESIRTSYNNRLNQMPHDSQTIELHNKFFNHEGILISEMTDTQILERRKMLELVAFEARARITRIDEEERKKDAKDPSRRNRISSIDYNDTIAINEVVKERKERLSKAEKEYQRYIALGMSEELAQQLVANLKTRATNVSINQIKSTTEQNQPQIVTSEFCRIDKHSECIGRFSDEVGSHECKCTCHDKPFNPAELFG